MLHTAILKPYGRLQPPPPPGTQVQHQKASIILCAVAVGCFIAPVCCYRVLKCDVIIMKFLKLWDLSGYFERTMSKRPTCQK